MMTLKTSLSLILFSVTKRSSVIIIAMTDPYKVSKIESLAPKKLTHIFNVSFLKLSPGCKFKQIALI